VEDATTLSWSSAAVSEWVASVPSLPHVRLAHLSSPLRMNLLELDFSGQIPLLSSSKQYFKALKDVIIVIVSGMQDCVAPYVDSILHRRQSWAISTASRSVRLWCLGSYWTVLSHVMRERPGCLFQSAGGKANRILLASALSSMRAMYPDRLSRRDWIIAVSLDCFVSLCTSYYGQVDAI